MSSIPSHHDYTVGGALRADAPTYVEREADEDFYRLLKDQEFCYVLNARQMGKTSLTVRIIGRLCDEGIVCASIDISTIGKSITEEQWYLGVIRSITRSLCIHRQQFNLSAWWIEQNMLSYVQRLSIFIEDVLLTVIVQPVVVFIDEIDSIRSLSFNVDDFFAAIRECYNRRASNPAYRRLTFALIGSSTPSALIQNKQIAPFNIGRSINLTGFRLEQAYPLAQGLAIKSSQPQKLLQVILNWTGGQPFLTQKLCQLVLTANSAPENGQEIEWVANLVRTTIIENWEVHDEPQHLKTIRDRMLYSDQQAGRLLGLYQQLLQQGELAANDRIEQLNLRLTGIAVNQDGKLRIYNPIYAAVFNENWVRQTLDDFRPYNQALQEWLASDRKDESRLLRGQALQDAKAWAIGKSLSDQDYDFLRASEQYEAKITLDAEKEANREANRILTEARRKAYWITGAAIIALVGSLIAAALASQQANLAGQEANRQKQEASNARQDWKEAQQKLTGVNQQLQTTKQDLNKAHQGVDLAKKEKSEAQQQFKIARHQLTVATTELDRAKDETQSAQQQTEEAQKRASQAKADQQLAELLTLRAVHKQHEARVGTQLEQTGLKLIQHFKVAELDNLLELMRIGHRLRNFVKDERYLENYPATSPLLALQLGLNRIHQRNRLNPPERVLSAAYSTIYNTNQQYLATGGNDGTIRIWDTLGRQITSWRSNHGQVLGISFSPHQQRLATVGSDGLIRIWNFTGNQLTSWQAHHGAARSVSFSRDGQQLATGGQDGIVRLWKLSGEKQSEWQAHKRGGIIHWSDVPEGVSVSFDPQGKQLATTGPDNVVRFWNLSGKQTKEFYIEQEVFGLDFSPDGRSLITADGFMKAVIRDLAGREQTQYISSRNGWVLDVDFSPDQRRFVAVGSDGIARIWDLSKRSNSEARAFAAYKNGAQVWQVGFSPDGQYIATLRDIDGKFRIRSVSQLDRVLIESDNISSFDFDSQKKYFILGTKSGGIQLWNLSKEQLLTSWTGHQKQVNSVRFSSDGKRVLTGGGDNRIRLWNLSAKDIPKKLAEWNRGFLAVLSPNDEHIAALGHDGTLRLWHMSGKVFFEKKIYIFSIGRLDFSPDGKLLAISIDDYAAPVRVWNLQGEEQARIIPPGEGRIEQVIFSPDGKVLATAGIDATARLWTLTGQQIAQFDVYPPGSGPWIRGLAFSPDGKLLATAVDPTGEVKIWRIETLDELLKRGCAWLGEYLAAHPEDLNSLTSCRP